MTYYIYVLSDGILNSVSVTVEVTLSSVERRRTLWKYGKVTLDLFARSGR